MLYLMSMYILQDYILFTVLYILLMMGSFIYSTPPISAATRPVFFARGLRHPLSRQEAFQQPEFWSPEKIPTRLNLSNLSRPDETLIS